MMTALLADRRQLLATMLQPNVLLALGLFAILSLLVLPPPRPLLDLLLAFSLLFAILILLTTLFVERPLDFNVFPTVLLFATMLRLGLNLATTRLILADGHEGPHAAGQVIEAFGNFIMRGNFLIGFIVFAILVIINFVVITKGSGRIAEVAARFSLDAMPGKQMAIDADLSAGLLDEATARRRRRELEEESAFFGAMDGAAKFVRGDAVAGLLITAVNLIGGLAVGMGQQGLDLAAAARTYTVLTVGDGLVSQIPALIVSTAAGILVTKSGLSGKTGALFFAQLGSPAVMGLGALVLALLGLLPGMPLLPLAGCAGGLGYLAWRLRGHAAMPPADAAAAAAAKPAPGEPATEAPPLDPLRLELGYALLPLIGEGERQQLPDQIRALRRQLAAELGFVMPSLRIQDNIQLPAHTYLLRIKDAEAGRGEVRPSLVMVLSGDGGAIPFPGEDTTEPTFGLPARWVSPQFRDEALAMGLTAVDAATVITTHLTELIKENLPDLLTIAELQRMLRGLGEDYQRLIADLVPARLPLGAIQRVLQSLLAERVSIRDLPLILEAIAEAGHHSANPVLLTEHVRGRLARQLSAQATGPDGTLSILALSPRWEQLFEQALVGEGERLQLALDPASLQAFFTELKERYEALALEGELPALVTSPRLRPYLRSLIERCRPSTVILSHAELHPKARLRTLGQL